MAVAFQNRVFCIAKNYEEHAKEMGGEIDRSLLSIFRKVLMQ